MRTCEIEGCDKKHLARGLCRLHYLRKYRTGDVGPVKPITKISAVERIKSKLIINENGCWIYTGRLTDKGYAHVRDDNREMRFAHRIMYEHVNGKMADGLETDHLCRNRACCNPGHMEAVTHKVNVRRGNAGCNTKPGSNRFLKKGEY